MLGREGVTMEVGLKPVEVGKGLAGMQVKLEVLLSEQQTSPGKCQVLISGTALPGRRAPAHTSYGQTWGAGGLPSLFELS